VIILLMGVSGSGKTTVGHLLAAKLGWEFADADDYHSAGNIEKMRNGIPLTDAERAPWLDSARVDGGLVSGKKQWRAGMLGVEADLSRSPAFFVGSPNHISQGNTATFRSTVARARGTFHEGADAPEPTGYP